MKALQDHGVPRVFRWGRGVDAEKFAPTRRDDALRARWSPTGAPIVGFVGRLAPEKHVERLAVLAGRRDLQIVIVGDGPERGRCNASCRPRCSPGSSRDSNSPRPTPASTCSCTPVSTRRSARRCRRHSRAAVPVIGPDAGGPKDLIAPMRTGYLLDVPSFEQRLPAAVDALLDPTVGPAFGAAARRSVAGRTWPSICDQLLGHYEAVVDRAGSLGVSRRTA